MGKIIVLALASGAVGAVAGYLTWRFFASSWPERTVKCEACGNPRRAELAWTMRGEWACLDYKACDDRIYAQQNLDRYVR